MDEASNTMEDLPSNDALINQLPDECLSHIFTFLPLVARFRIEQVCKRWHTIGKRGWNDIKKLPLHYTYPDNIILGLLQRCGRFVKELTIYESEGQLNYLSMVIEFCRLDQLEIIDILGVDKRDEDGEINTRNLREIFRRATKLGTVNIYGNHIFNRIDYLYCLNPKTLRTLVLLNDDREPILLPIINLDRFPNLKELRLIQFAIFGDERERGEESLEKLEKINLGLCRILINIIRRIETFKNLQELTLKLNGCDMTNEHIRSIAKNCRKMKKISLTCSPSMTSECFQYLGKILSLEELELSHFDNVNSGDMACLTNVKRLRIGFHVGIHESNGLIELITESSSLETLELSYISTLNTTFLSNVSQIFRAGRRVKRLRLKLNVDSEDQLFEVQWETFHHPLLDLRVIRTKTQTERELDGDQ